MIVNPYVNTASDHYQRRPETCHHILAQSRAGTSVKDNKIKLYDNFHNAFHTVFGNLNIREQLSKILSISNTAITEDFKQDIFKILKETEDDYYYKD